MQSERNSREAKIQSITGAAFQNSISASSCTWFWGNSGRKPKIFCGCGLDQIHLSLHVNPDTLGDVKIRAQRGPQHHFLNSLFFFTLQVVPHVWCCCPTAEYICSQSDASTVETILSLQHFFMLLYSIVHLFVNVAKNTNQFFFCIHKNVTHHSPGIGFTTSASSYKHVIAKSF